MAEEQKKLTKAQVASKAQAKAHKTLREENPERYQKAYQEAKEELAART